MEELFVPVEDYDNYVVSNYGRVVSVKRDIDLSPSRNKDGRLTVSLYKNGVPKTFYVHRLVAQAFFINYSQDTNVRHISIDYDDNSVGNLTLV